MGTSAGNRAISAARSLERPRHDAGALVLKGIKTNDELSITEISKNSHLQDETSSLRRGFQTKGLPGYAAGLMPSSRIRRRMNFAVRKSVILGRPNAKVEKAGPGDNFLKKHIPIISVKNMKKNPTKKELTEKVLTDHLSADDKNRVVSSSRQYANLVNIKDQNLMRV